MSQTNDEDIARYILKLSKEQNRDPFDPEVMEDFKKTAKWFRDSRIRMVRMIMGSLLAEKNKKNSKKRKERKRMMVLFNKQGKLL